MQFKKKKKINPNYTFVATLHQKPILSYLADPRLFYSEVKYE